MGPVLEVGAGLLGFMSATRRAVEQNLLANSGCSRGSLCKACGIKVRIICNEGLRCGLQVLAASDFTSTRVVGLKRFISPSQSRPFCVSYPRSPSLIRSAHKAENRASLGTALNYVMVGRAARAKLFAADPVAVTCYRPERHCLATLFCSQIAMLAPT